MPNLRAADRVMVRSSAHSSTGTGGVWYFATSWSTRSDARWNAAFDEAMLAFLLDMVRAEVHPRTYQAFEAFALGGCSGAEAARLTGLTPNAVYQARKNILRRLRELGAAFDGQGPPDEMLRAAIRLRPSAVVERSLLTRIERTIQPSAMPNEEPR